MFEAPGEVRAHYRALRDELGEAMQPFLDGLLRRHHLFADELARSYFSTRLVLPRGRGGQAAQQEQQQQ